jgi:hypothetical protein
VPISGTLDVAGLVPETPLAGELATEPVVLERAEVLYVMSEIDSSDREAMLPPALHPTDPPTATFVWIRCQDSPFGSFALAQTRVGCRAGVRPRGYVVGSVIDNKDAAGALADGWGFGCGTGEVDLSRGYHEIRGRVDVNGRTILAAAASDPVPLSGAEIQFAATMQLARVPRDGAVEPRLVQVDPDFTFHRAARGRPSIDEFDADAWGEPRIRPVYPISAWYSLCDLTLPRVRYICDPDVAALQGTEKVG